MSEDEHKNAEFRVPGFLANGIAVGIKEEGIRDLSLIFSEVPATAAALFTTNCFKAAPVLLDIDRIEQGVAQAIIANSGNANASTGSEGYSDVLKMSRAVSGRLGIDDNLVLVASTGVIGQKLPVGRIIDGIDELVDGLHEDGITDAQQAIMTTDKFAKMEIRKTRVSDREITVCGIAKGAGMIAPHMATMLSFIMTDIRIDKESLDKIFKRTVDKSFNAISVDGCMSTNDTVLVLANGCAGNAELKGASRDMVIFCEALESVMTGLAKSIVRDGEGATKVIEINVTHARSKKDAKAVAYGIANSNLVKTAFFGKDPNWGRIIAAVGSSGVRVSTDSVELYFDDTPIFLRGGGVAKDDEKLSYIMKQQCIAMTVNLRMGNKSFRLYTSDLSYEYVTINAHYRT